jgi:uncharacterized protein (DUF2062 family)
MYACPDNRKTIIFKHSPIYYPVRCETVKKALKSYWHDVISIKTSPHSIAIGFAVGTFISILPTPGFNILLGLLAVFVYKGISKISLFGSMAVWNPITLFPIYLASYRIGDFLYGSVPVVRYNVVILDQIYNLSRRFLVGNVLLAVVVSVVGYFIVRFIAVWYLSRRD